MTEAELATVTYWAEFWSGVEHWAFLGVVIALAIEFAALKFAAPYKEKLEAVKDLKIAELNNETAKLRKQLAPRLITQAQQNELTAKLSEFKNERGTIVASPSTPESEMFVRVLAAPLLAAGWKIDILPGTSTATLLFPTGVMVWYAADMSKPLTSPEKS